MARKSQIWPILGFAGDRQTIDAVPSVRLASLAPGIVFELNERDLSLRLTARPELLGLQRLTLKSDRPPGLIYSNNSSAFLNYAVNWDRSTGGGGFFDAGVSASGALFATTVVRSANRPFVRGQSSITFDDPHRMRRWVVGDAFANTGLLGGGAFVGGVSLSREYGLDPYFLRYPTLEMAGAVTSPSTLEVYVNDRLVGRKELAPGRFDLASLPASTGRGVARLVLRDAFGREQEPACGERLVCSRHRPELLEGDTRIAREPLDVRPLREVDQGVARHGRTDDLALEHERRATTAIPYVGATITAGRSPVCARHWRAHSAKMPGSYPCAVSTPNSGVEWIGPPTTCSQTP